MKRFLLFYALLLCINIIYGKYDWTMVLPPDSTHDKNLLGLYSYCKQGTCSVLTAFVSGDIYGINLNTKEITTYHLSASIQNIATHSSPKAMNTFLNSFAISGDQNMIYVTDQQSGIWFMSLDPNDNLNFWQRTGPDATTTKQVMLIVPISTPTSTNLLCAYSFGNNNVALMNVMYGTTQNIGQYDSGPNAVALYYSSTLYRTASSLIQQDYVAVGTTNGAVSLFVLRYGTVTSYRLGLGTSGEVGKFLDYRNGKSFWLLFNVIDKTNKANNQIWIYDLNAAGTQISGLKTEAFNMMIFSDSVMNDWLVFSNSSGVYKTKMNQLITNAPEIISLTSSYDIFTSREITQIIQTYLVTTDDDGNSINNPVLLIASKKGTVSILPDGATEWIEILSPTDIWTEGDEIQMARIIPTSEDNDGIPSFSLIVVLNDGAVLVQPNILQNFTRGSADMALDESFIPASSFSDLSDTSTPKQEGILSWNQLQNLVNQDDVIVLTLQDASGNKVDFALQGYVMNSHNMRSDIASIKLSLINSANTQLTMTNSKEKNLKFLFELFEIIEISYEALCWGIEIVETAGEFIYLATEIYNNVF